MILGWCLVFCSARVCEVVTVCHILKSNSRNPGRVQASHSTFQCVCGGLLIPEAPASGNRRGYPDHCHLVKGRLSDRVHDVSPPARQCPILKEPPQELQYDQCTINVNYVTTLKWARQCAASLRGVSPGEWRCP